MAEPIKSVLLLDYESLHRSLSGAAGDTRLADRAAAWIAAIESGRLIGPEGRRRHIMLKRCYAGPSVRGKQRDVLTAAGFEVVDAADGSARSSADLYMAMDTVDALGRPEGYEEFILLSGASELAPLLTRLKANKRMTAIFADAETPENDKTLADALLESVDFARFMTSDDMPASEIRVPSPSGGSDRVGIEAFARKIHAATNIPLFSPKSFAELFRHLTDEIAANGYHFQTTAKNVADRMVATGRSVTRRQVVFIVKGLALKGHVFSTSDTPERLAEVFREQAHYLISNAGISLDAHQEELLSAWFMSRSPASEPAASPSRVPAEAKATIEETIEREVAKASLRPPAPERQRPSARPTASAKPPTVKVEMPKSTAKMTPHAKPGPSPSAREEAKAVIAARIAASAKLKPGNRAPIPAKAAPKPAPPPPPPVNDSLPDTEAETAPPARSTQQNSAALEHSILAAIAEAVDVLVEDSTDEERPSREPPAKKKTTNGPRPDETPPPPPRAEEEDPDSGDIGDQIQRIIATYTRNRTEE